MKKTVLSLVVLFAISTSIFSQVKYNSSGYFGIGTANPNYTVHVEDGVPTLMIESTAGNDDSYLRFTEANNLAGGYLHYDGSANRLNIGMHNAWDSNPANDKPVIQLIRSTGQVQFFATSTQPNVASFPGPGGNSWGVGNGIGDWFFWVDDAGSVHYNEIYTLSDESSKTDITTLSNSIELLRKLRPITFRYKPGYYGLDTKSDLKYGLLAQELQDVIPELVSSRGDTLLEVNYIGLIPLLLDAVQKQQQEIDELKSQIASEKQTNEFQTSSVSSDLVKSSSLFQNAPNPFNENTIVKYIIPTTASKAMINVYDLQGKQVMSHNIYQNGIGEIIIPTTELDPGIYIYNLIVDDYEVDSKRMILTD